MRAIATTLLLVVLAVWSAAARGHDDGPAGVPAPSAFWAGPAMSGAWFNPERSGEGIILEVLDSGAAVAIWFTFPASGEAASQAWLLADAGQLSGDRIQFQVSRPLGGRFGDAFDPADVRFEPWGELSLQFSSCSTAQLQWQGPSGFGGGGHALQRLSTVDEIDCQGPRRLTASGARAGAGLGSKSGAWFEPDRSGEGWLYEELADGQGLIYWFTFDPAGEQAWVIGLGRREGDRFVAAQAFSSRGTHFGDGFDAAAVELPEWGRIEVEFLDCQRAELSYASLHSEWGSGQRSLQRLTRLAGAPCLDDRTSEPDGQRWLERARMPAPYASELAACSLDGVIYALGGFGRAQGFQRYLPTQDRWETLPDMPVGRHHLAAFALDGAVYFSGGGPLGSGDQTLAAHRYLLAEQRWQALEGFAFNYGAHAAVLHGNGYVADLDGSLQQFSPNGQRLRRIAPADLVTPRDHSQLVAFLDELWLLAGRFPEHTEVAIYDPVSERWRAGPRLRVPRAGFAATATEQQIIVAGGEFLAGPDSTVEPSSERYRAGAEGWQFGPPLPVPVHGTAAAAVAGRVFVISGSTRAGSVAGATGRVFELLP